MDGMGDECDPDDDNDGKPYHIVYTIICQYVVHHHARY